MEVSNNMKEIVAQLSNREKKLLYFLVCFLIVVGGWFLVISPALDKNSKLNVEYQSVLIQNTTKQTELSQYLNAQDELKIKEDNLNQLIEKYNPILSNEKIDKLLTSTFLSQGLTPISMTISSIADIIEFMEIIDFSPHIISCYKRTRFISSKSYRNIICQSFFRPINHAF